MNLVLKARKRDLGLKPKNLFKQHLITAEFYGAQTKNQHLILEYQAFRKIFQVGGESTIIDLVVEDGEPEAILIHQVQYDVLTNQFRHVDLLKIDHTKRITTRVPIKFTGISPAVKNFGGVFTHNKTEIEIKCLPKDLIKEIVLDIGNLTELNSALRIADLPSEFTQNLEISEEAKTIICKIEAPKTSAQVEAELATENQEAVSAEIKQEGEAEKAAAQASKESDKEKKGRVK